MVLLGSLGTSEASAYYSLTMESQTTVSSPEVILQNGIAGTSTIYTNNTSAKVSVKAPVPIYDFVDNNTSDVDNSVDKGKHSNFTAQKYGLDSIYDNVTESGGFVLAVEELSVALSTSQTSNSGTLVEVSNTTQAVPFATRYATTSGGTIDAHESQLTDISISGTTVTVQRTATDSKAITTTMCWVEFAGSINVYSGTFTISASTSGTTSIGATVDLSKSFLVFYYRSNASTSNEHAYHAVRGYFSNTSQLTFELTSSNTVDGHWWVVEDTGSNFDVDEVDIQLAGVASNTGSFSAVNMASAMVVASYEGGNLDDIIDGGVSVYLSSTTQITAIRGGTNGTIDVTAYVIEFSGVTSVQRGDISYTSNDTSLSDTIAEVTLDDAMAWIPTGWINTCHCTSGGTESSDNLDVIIRVRLTSSTQIMGDRNNNGQNDAVLRWEVVEWEVGSEDYQLDIEVQFTAVVDFLPTETLCIYAGTLGGEDLGVDFWNGSGWEEISADLTANSWNNHTVPLTSATFTIRFKGGNETGDTEIQDSWLIDATLLRVGGAGNKEDAVDNDTSDVDSSADFGSVSSFGNMKAFDSLYANLTESAPEGIAYINATEASATSGTSAQVNKPANTAEEDFMMALLASTIGSDTNGSTMFSAPSGWTNEHDYTQNAASGQHIYVYWKVAGASEPSNYNWTWTDSCGWVAQITTFRGVDTTSPIHVEGAVNQESSSSPMSPSVTTIVDNAMVWLYDICDAVVVPAAGGAPSGTTWIDQTEVASPGNGIGISTAYFVQASAGATGNRNWTLDESDENSGQQYALKPVPVEYQLDQEVQWTDLPYQLPNEELCIYSGTTGVESIRVDIWNTTTSAWDNVFSDLNTNSWNNASVTKWLTGSNFTMRFKGGNEIGDVTQSSWNIDAAFLHVWTPGTCDYVLRVNNTVTDSWQIRLKKYSDSNINRLQNCTIYFHNSSDGNSREIYIEDGSYTNQTGPWYDLGDSETIYITMTVEAKAIGTSYVYTYLEIRVAGTTTYLQYIIEFEIS